MEKRKELHQELFNGFLKDLVESSASLTDDEEKIYFLETLCQLIKEIRTDESFQFDVQEFINQKLFSKLRSKMKSFASSFMEFYFFQDEACQKIIFRKLKINTETPFLNHDEFDELLATFGGALRLFQKGVYVKEKPEPLILELIANPPIQNDGVEGKMPGFNRSRQALMIYYLLKSQGVTKNTVSITAMAKFTHVLLGWPYSDIDNSELYKRLKQIHNVKENKTRLSDLEFIKKQFELIEHSAIIALIDEEIDKLKRK